MKEIEKEDELWEESQRKKAKLRAITRTISSTEAAVSPKLDTSASQEKPATETPKMKTTAPPRFY
jgi:hypothetical protein